MVIKTVLEKHSLKMALYKMAECLGIKPKPHNLSCDITNIHGYYELIIYVNENACDKEAPVNENN
jgi:hypothetical protein